VFGLSLEFKISYLIRETMSFRFTLPVRITGMSLDVCSCLIRMPRVQILQEWKDQPVRQRYGIHSPNFSRPPHHFVTSSVRTTQGQGLMPDKTSRFKCKGKDIYHFVRLSISRAVCCFNLTSIA
jgi:hypothetical protein